ncbi:MAG: YcaO-like family protein [Pseudomonadota bacterium]
MTEESLEAEVGVWSNTTELIEIPCSLRALCVDQTLQTVEKTAHDIGVTRIANVTGLDRIGIPTCMVVRPGSKSLSVSQGKGRTWKAAKVSGLMEAIELFHAENLPSGQLIRACDFGKSEAIPNLLDLSIRASSRVSADHEIECLPARELTTQALRFVPRELIDLDTTSGSRRDRIFRSSTVGLAAGNTLGESVLHGLLEVVESDCVSFWQVRRLIDEDTHCRKLNLCSVSDHDSQSLISLIARAGLDLSVWYISDYHEIPCFMATISDQSVSSGFPKECNGFGCHVSKSVALCRALLEAAQSRLTAYWGVRDDLSWQYYLKEKDKWSSLTHRQPESEHRHTGILSYNNIREMDGTKTVEASLSWTTSELSKAGIENVNYVDLTSSEFKVPVTFTVVPRMEQFELDGRYLAGARMSTFLRKLNGQ